MKEEEIYTQWKNHRRQANVPENFTAVVMQKIEPATDEIAAEFPASLTGLPDRIAAWGAALGLVLLGLFRIFFIVGNLLQPHVLPY